MQQSIALLDKALELAKEELSSLRGGDVDGAQARASERFALTEEAWTLRQSGMTGMSGEGNPMLQLQAKLEQLQAMQSHITMEARRLHASIKEELLRSRKESTRHGAYGKALRPTAGNGLVPNSRFVSKRG